MGHTKKLIIICMPIYSSIATFLPHLDYDTFVLTEFSLSVADVDVSYDDVNLSKYEV
jgi:hypothetical protein